MLIFAGQAPAQGLTSLLLPPCPTLPKPLLMPPLPGEHSVPGPPTGPTTRTAPHRRQPERLSPEGLGAPHLPPLSRAPWGLPRVPLACGLALCCLGWACFYWDRLRTQGSSRCAPTSRPFRTISAPGSPCPILLSVGVGPPAWSLVPSLKRQTPWPRNPQSRGSEDTGITGCLIFQEKCIQTFSGARSEPRVMVAAPLTPCAWPAVWHAQDLLCLRRKP